MSRVVRYHRISMSGLVDGTGGAVAAKFFAGILTASSIALGGVAAAETGRQVKSSQARPSERVPRATAAQVAAWAQEAQERREHPCAATFRERLTATRSVLRSYPATVRDYERDYRRQMPWFARHCHINEAHAWHDTSSFFCSDLDGHPPGVTVLGITEHHQFVVKRPTEPPLGFFEKLKSENARCVSRDPVSLRLHEVEPRSDGWQVPKLVRELRALVPSDPHSVRAETIENLIYDVGQRVQVIEVLCFASKMATCADARELLRAIAATRTEMQRIADGQRPEPAQAATVTPRSAFRASTR